MTMTTDNLDAVARVATWLISVGWDVLPVGRNPEAADPGNPQGYIYAKRWFIRASRAVDAAYEYTHFHLMDDDVAAERLAKKMERAERRGEFDPSDPDNPHWDARKIYGGPEWSHADEHDLQRLDVEADDGPGGYTPSHPGYLG